MRLPSQTHLDFIPLSHLVLAAQGCHKYGYGQHRVYSEILTILH